MRTAPTPTAPMALAKDGYYHPASEADVVALVRFAAGNGLQIRVRGAAHSVAWAIFTDPVEDEPANRTLEVRPPPGPALNLALDRMDRLHWVDKANGIVEVEAGCHLGHDPNDPFDRSTLANSFVHRIFEQGWAVDVLGGITHQTVGGFTATGSAGGSTHHAFTNMTAFRIVDGMGNADWIEDIDPAFPAMIPSLGLMGIVTAIRFQLVPMYNIQGSETTTPIGADCPIDLFGSGHAGRPSLETFLAAQDYTRLTWWPQSGIERVQIWRAERVPATSTDLAPYREFSDTFAGWTEQFLGSVMFVLLGNNEPHRVARLLRDKAGRYLELLTRMNRRRGGWKAPPRIAAGAAVSAMAMGLGWLIARIDGAAAKLFAMLLPVFQPMTRGLAGAQFTDWYWRSLCMDNTADDDLLSTEFNEIWVPIGRAGQVVNLLQAMFDARGVQATGWFELEIYPGPPSKGWLNPGYTGGSDEYANGACRFDIYWYRDNPGMPNGPEGFYEQYWSLLRDNGVPFRFHWGKYVPEGNSADWAAFYRHNLPRLGDFLALRDLRDPKGVFFTRYWQSRLAAV